MKLAQLFTILFFTLLTIKTLLELYLSKRNENYVKNHMGEVPSAFANKISLQEHQKAAYYTIAKSRFSQATLLISVLTFIIWLPLGVLDKLDIWLHTFIADEILRGLALFGLFGVINLVIALPEKIYSTFVLEEKFGFNKMTPKLFVTDMVKQLILAVAIGGPFLYVLLLIINRLGDYWWLYAWGFLVSFQLLMVLIYPSFIAPLFNKFTKLENETLKEKIEKLLKNIGFAHSGIYVMDASRRSGHGNAYFTGFGKTKRIVFFDTLLKSLNDNEIEAVLAHELGHFKHKHITKMLVISVFFALISFWVLGFCYKTEAFYHGHFVTYTSSYMALLLFSLVSPLYTFFLTPVMSIFSRKNEYEADSFAAKYSNASDLVSALVNLYKENASTLTPDPLFSKVYHSHPPAYERIKHLESL
ncbi:MAG: M48 family metallopeptidase [Halobacteriovoraceae bacterium]|nr:M48 family metallopeptidase [Halobacteriovoraceae bacterium]MCB9095576.1 M48 family metallopeptidase [Halobacteriovoraceae bacterium]